MKRYKKDKEIKFSRDITIRKNGMVTYNPTEDMLKENGWEEYIPEAYEPTEEEQLVRVKEEKKRDIDHYVNSIKCLEINGEEVSLDVDTLNKMFFRVLAEDAMHINKTNLWFNGKKHKMKTKDALELLYQLQIYFGECFDISQELKSNINNNTNIDDIHKHEYRDKFPKKVKFDLK